MPIYEYVCQSCQQPFEALIMGSEKAECPACGSSKLEKQLSVFAVNEDKRPEIPPSPCESCDNPAGPGSCGMM